MITAKIEHKFDWVATGAANIAQAFTRMPHPFKIGTDIATYKVTAGEYRNLKAKENNGFVYGELYKRDGHSDNWVLWDYYKNQPKEQ